MLIDILIIIGIILSVEALYHGFKKDFGTDSEFKAKDLFFKKSQRKTRSKKQLTIEATILFTLTILLIVLKIFSRELKEILG